MFGHLGMVDKRVAVVLMCVDSLVAVNLFGADRVLAVPFKQQIDGPLCKDRIGVAGEHI